MNRYGASYFEGATYRYGIRRGSVEQLAMDSLRWAGKYADWNIADGRGKKALDVGCAYGYVLSLLESLRYRAIGLDISSFALAMAQKMECPNDEPVGPGADLVLSSVASSLPFTECFDLVTCFEVLEHLKDPFKALNNIWQTVGPGGVLVGSTPNHVALYHRLLDRDNTHISVKSYLSWKLMLQRLPNLSLGRVQCFGPVFPSKIVGRSFIVRMPVFGSSTRILAQKN